MNNQLRNDVKEIFLAKLKGGKGSGNFGHSGIAGHHGGSAPRSKVSPGWIEDIDPDWKNKLETELDEINNRETLQAVRDSGLNLFRDYDEVPPVRNGCTRLYHGTWQENLSDIARMGLINQQDLAMSGRVSVSPESATPWVLFTPKKQGTDEERRWHGNAILIVDVPNSMLPKDKRGTSEVALKKVPPEHIRGAYVPKYKLRPEGLSPSNDFRLPLGDWDAMTDMIKKWRSEYENGGSKEIAEKGGTGSGFFGHAGIPGHHGGSAASTGVSSWRGDVISQWSHDTQVKLDHFDNLWQVATPSYADSLSELPFRADEPHNFNYWIDDSGKIVYNSVGMGYHTIIAAQMVMNGKLKASDEDALNCAWTLNQTWPENEKVEKIAFRQGWIKINDVKEGRGGYIAIVIPSAETKWLRKIQKYIDADKISNKMDRGYTIHSQAGGLYKGGYIKCTYEELMTAKGLGINRDDALALKEAPDALAKIYEVFRTKVDASFNDLQLGKIDVDKWRKEMEDLLAQHHYAAYMVGAKSESVPASRVSWIDGEIKKQKQYLLGFAQLIENTQKQYLGETDQDMAWNAWRSRAMAYVPSITPSYWRGAIGDLPLPAYPGDGTCEGESHCGCRWEIKPVGANDFDCYWKLGSGEHCETCQKRAHEWNPLKIRSGQVIKPSKLPKLPDLKNLFKERLKGGRGSGYFDHAGRPGKRGGSAPSSEADPFALFQESSRAFRSWFGNSKVVDSRGNPLPVYHGTAANFTTFSRSTPEAFVGEGYYFTDSPEEASENYAFDTGPDVRMKIEQAMDAMSDYYMSNYYDGEEDKVIEQIQKKLGLSKDDAIAAYNGTYKPSDPDWGDGDWEEYGKNSMQVYEIKRQEALRRIGRENLGVVMKTYLRMEKPFVLSSRNDATTFYLDDSNIITDAKSGRRINFDKALKKTIEGGDWDFPRHMGDDTGTIVESIKDRMGIYDSGRAKSGSLFDSFRNNIEVYGSDGTYSPGDFFGKLVKNMGYDGLIIQAGEYFPSMSYTSGSRHFIVFDKKQIKSYTGNIGTFSRRTGNITKERIKGGEGSGFFGHAGIPGHHGGSSSRSDVSPGFGILEGITYGKKPSDPGLEGARFAHSFSDISVSAGTFCYFILPDDLILDINSSSAEHRDYIDWVSRNPKIMGLFGLKPVSRGNASFSAVKQAGSIRVRGWSNGCMVETDKVDTPTLRRLQRLVDQDKLRFSTDQNNRWSDETFSVKGSRHIDFSLEDIMSAKRVVEKDGEISLKETESFKELFVERFKGGEGSGYFGHAGIPGHHGGSAARTGVAPVVSSPPKSERLLNAQTFDELIKKGAKDRQFLGVPYLILNDGTLVGSPRRLTTHEVIAENIFLESPEKYDEEVGNALNYLVGNRGVIRVSASGGSAALELGNFDRKMLRRIQDYVLSGKLGRINYMSINSWNPPSMTSFSNMDEFLSASDVQLAPGAEMRLKSKEG